MDDPAFKPKKRKPREQREAEIEKYGGTVVHYFKGESFKFTSPGRRGVPDRLKLFPIPPEHREIVARYVVFVEYKKERRGVLSEDQIREIKILRDLGFAVHVIDTKADVDALIALPRS